MYGERTPNHGKGTGIMHKKNKSYATEVIGPVPVGKLHRPRTWSRASASINLHCLSWRPAQELSWGTYTPLGPALAASCFYCFLSECYRCDLTFFLFKAAVPTKFKGRDRCPRPSPVRIVRVMGGDIARSSKYPTPEIWIAFSHLVLTICECWTLRRAVEVQKHAWL